MRENLSAPGSLDRWMTASEDALWNAGFDNVGFDPDINTDRLYGDYGASEYIDIDFSVAEPGRVYLAIEASSRAMIEKYKASVAAEIKRTPRKPVSSEEEEAAYDNYAPPADPRPVARFPDKVEEKIPRDKRGIPIYAKTWFILLALVLLPPLGIFLLFFCRKFRLIPRLAAAILALAYTLLIWVGFFGVNTGFNRDTVNMWYKDARSQITRMLHKNEDTTTQTTAAPSATPQSSDDDTAAVDESGVIQVPVNQSSSQDSQESQGFFERILENFQGQ
ncbi:MAG: hypothetical protein Q4C55_01890 [Eubacterium sp.]|nr:hypothetical protein [Eubacterium sp.]